MSKKKDPFVSQLGLTIGQWFFIEKDGIENMQLIITCVASVK